MDFSHSHQDDANVNSRHASNPSAGGAGKIIHGVSNVKDDHTERVEALRDALFASWVEN